MKFNDLYKLIEDQLEGGAADEKMPQDIVDKWGVSLEIIEQAIRLGIEVEMAEHTKDKDVAMEIVMDHLYKDGADYYDRLGKMEDEAEADRANEV